MKHFWQSSLLALSKHLYMLHGVIKAGKATAGIVHSASRCTPGMQVKQIP